MNKDIKQQWITALRSGEYKQGREHLVTPDGSYCCLGVLCDLAEKAGVVAFSTTFRHFVSTEDRGDFSSSSLPVAVRNWAGLDSGDPAVDKVNIPFVKVVTLAQLNDEFRYGFDQIADVIEESL